jgi:hypothetical protein
VNDDSDRLTDATGVAAASSVQRPGRRAGDRYEEEDSYERADAYELERRRTRASAL